MINLAKKEKGFTLIELLIVISIIGILAAIAIPQFASYRERAYDSQAKSALYNLYLACKAYWADNASSDACTLEQASTTTYGFLQDGNISVVINNGEENTFDVDSKHTSSSKSYSIDSLGNIYDSD